MTVEVENFLFKATFDAKEATRGSQRFEKELKSLTAQEDALAKQSLQLRGQIIKLTAEELKGGEGAKKASLQRKAANILLKEERLEAEKCRRAITALRLEHAKEAKQAQATARAHDQLARSTARSEQATAREATRSAAIVARESARAEAIRERSIRASARTSAINARAIESATGRSGRADDKIRSNASREISSARAINQRETAIAALDKRLMELQQGTGRQAFGRMNKSARSFASEHLSNQGIDRHSRSAVTRFAGGVPGAVAGGAKAVAGGLVAGAGVVGGIAAAGGGYEKLRTGLTTAMGGNAKEGDKAFQQIKQFARETPYAVEEVTRAVTTLKVRGLEPTVEAALEAMRTYGDVAGAMGKDLPTVIEAVSDASVGEFERLKEAFNVTGHKAGDELKLTFNGVTTQVHNDAQSITGYLKGIGKANFAGGMARQAATLEGSWSSLGDSIMTFADEIYRGGLGDALKEVLGDMTANVDGSENLASMIGEKLGEAVKGTYEFFKELLGPVGELPGKFQSAWEKGEKFVSVVGNLIEAGVSLAETIGTDNIALIALAAAAASALGPLGAVAVASTAIGWAIAEAIMGGNEKLMDLEDTLGRMRHTEHVKEMARQQKVVDELQDDLATTTANSDARKAAGDRIARAELRALGATTSAEVAALPEEEKLRITRMRSQAETNFDKAVLGGSTSLEDRQKRADSFAGGREHRADEAVYDRLSKIKKGKRTLAQDKELKETAARLGKKVPTGGGGKGKVHLTAAEQEQKARIDDAVKNEELRAADTARLTGHGKDALALAKTAGTETRDRLEGMAKRGDLLPQEIDDAFERVAGYENQAGAPPPPVVVKEYKIDVHFSAPLQATGFDGSPEDFGNQAIAHINDGLEQQIYPRMRQELQSEILR
jgi:hypothetical protein